MNVPGPDGPGTQPLADQFPTTCASIMKLAPTKNDMNNNSGNITRSGTVITSTGTLADADIRSTKYSTKMTAATPRRIRETDLLLSIRGIDIAE